MSAEELRVEIADEVNDVEFIYNGKRSGIIPQFETSTPTFLVWYGDVEKVYSDIDDVMSDKFFDGKSLAEIAEIVKYT
ncbi:MAG: hypothetical protein HFH39_11720 [Lachnospiraceae bacterium]|nr:hypothetical protein [Bacilli bacterium]MCI9005875.1 hypothetical protein [Lachnospiraceae bacterium]